MVRKTIKTRTEKCPHCKETTTQNLEAEILNYFYTEFWRCQSCVNSNRGTGTIEQLYCVATESPSLMFEERKNFHATQDISNNITFSDRPVAEEVFLGSPEVLPSSPEVGPIETIFICTHKYNCSAHEKICRAVHGIIKPQGKHV